MDGRIAAPIDEGADDAALGEMASGSLDPGLVEGQELVAGHFPARHRELAMVLPGDMSADRNIVGNVGEDETSLRVRHQPRQHVGGAGVAAGNQMSAERENVTRPGDRLERDVRLKWAVLGDLGLLINNDLVDLDL